MLRKCHKNLIKKARMTFRKGIGVIYKKGKLKKEINNIYIIYIICIHTHTRVCVCVCICMHIDRHRKFDMLSFKG